MSQTHRQPAPAAGESARAAGPAEGPSTDPGRERLRRRLGFTAVVACLPYLTLKLLWVCGVDVGVVDRSRVGHAVWLAANLVTFLMDAVAALIAYLLTRPGGPRVRNWLVALPMWMASGLLSVIMLAVPFDLARVLFGAPNLFTQRDGFLDPWVFAVVYGGFIVEGVVLLGAFAMYAHDHQGRLLRAPVREVARHVPAAARTAAAAAAGLLVVTAVVRLAWAFGAEFGLTAQHISRTTTGMRTSQGVQALLALAAAAGLAVIARGRSGLRSRLPLAAAWVGSAAAFSWGGLLGDLGALARSDDRFSAFMIAVYLAETSAGLLVLGAGLYGLPAATPGAANPADHAGAARRS